MVGHHTGADPLERRNFFFQYDQLELEELSSIDRQQFCGS